MHLLPGVRGGVIDGLEKVSCRSEPGRAHLHGRSSLALGATSGRLGLELAADASKRSSAQLGREQLARLAGQSDD